MKHTNNYDKHKKLDDQDRRELLAAVKAHGGTFRWLDKNGEKIDSTIDTPIITGSWKFAEETEDYIVTHVEADGDYVGIYGFPKSGLFDDTEPIYYICHGHISYITDSIPETEEVTDVSEAVSNP